MFSNKALKKVTITTVISTGIMLCVLIFNKPTLRIVFGSVDEDVMTAAIIYFVISGLSYPFLAIYNSCAALFRSMGNSRIPMIISIFINVTNVTLNVISIFVFHAGVMGIALAALIARGIAAVIMMYLSLDKNNEIFICFSEIFSWKGSMIKRILNIPIGYILGIVFKMGVIGIWVAMGFDWMLRSVIYIVRFKSGRWKEFQVI